MNQWTINTQYSGPDRQEQHKTAVSPSYAPTAPGPALQLFYSRRNGLDELFMVVSAAARVTQVSFSGAGFAQESVGVAYYEQLGATELKYELTGSLLASIRDFSGKLELTLRDATDATYDYVIPAANSASVIAAVARPADRNRFIVPAVFLGVFLLGVGLIGFGAEDAARPPVSGAPTLTVTAPPAAPHAAAGPPVSAELYQWALNCAKIEFLTSARGREPFAEETLKRMETDLDICQAAPEVRVACAAENCGRKFHAITEYSTRRLNEFYQKHPSLTTQLTLAAERKFISAAVPITSAVPAEKPPAARARTAPEETLPTETEALAALEREVLGGILNNQNLRGGGRKNFDSRREVQAAPINKTPARRQSPPAPRTYTFNELDRGAQVQLTYSCPARTWGIKFVWGAFAIPADLDLELTWPDGEITTYAAQSGPTGLRFITAPDLAPQFQKFSDGLLFVHINYDHNYHWDLEEISANKQIPGC